MFATAVSERIPEDLSEEEGIGSDSSEEDTQDSLSNKEDFKAQAEGEKYYSKTDSAEKPGIELTGYSLDFFRAVEAVLENRRKRFLEKLLPNFLNSCKKILEYCPGMSTFEGSWQRESSIFLSIDEAERFVGEDFFNGMICLFDMTLKGKNLTTPQTEQILGSFFISSLLKLHGKVMLQGFFHEKLRNLAEKLRDNPLNTKNPAGREQGIRYISEIFQSNVFATGWVLNAQKQFEYIFQNLESQNKQLFTELLTLFFLKPFPFEVIMNTRFIANNIRSKNYEISPLVGDLEQRILLFKKRGIALISTPEKMGFHPSLVEELIDFESKAKQLEKKQSLVKKHASYIHTAFKTIKKALGIVRDATGFEILGKHKILDEFEAIIKIETPDPQAVNLGTINTNVANNLNPIFHQYFVAIHARKLQQNDFFDIFEASLVNEKLQQIIQETTITLDMDSSENNLSSKAIVLPPPVISLYTRSWAAVKNKLRSSIGDDVTINPHNLEVVPDNQVEFKVRRAAFLKGKRHFICCYPRDRETFSALLNANPLVKALLLSQVSLAVTLQILRVDNHFKDASTVMWFEPVLGVIGFTCGVYALRNPKTLVNTPVRILEALSVSLVVLTKSLGIAILVHTAQFPEEGGPGGIDIERFLKVVASAPIALALLSWVYNSLSPNFKKKHFSKCARFIFEIINHFAIYSGLNQIISIDVVKIVNRIDKIDFSSQFSRVLFEFLPMLPAVFFAYVRVAPIRFCSRKSNVYVNISETINTAVLYLFTTVLLTNLGIDLSVADNLPTAQANFRRIFFPGLVFASIAVITRFARSFPVLYDGNPEVIIQQVIKERGLQPMGDGTFSLANNAQRLLSRFGDSTNSINDDSDDESNPNLNYDQAEQLRQDFGVSAPSDKKSAGSTILLMFGAMKEKRHPQHSAAHHEGNRIRCGSCAIL